MSRPSKHEHFLRVAELTATQGTCARRQVGCVLVNRRYHVIGTGYNGPASGLPHCIDSPCAGAHFPSGQSLDKCEAIHAEANALLQCKDVYDIHTAYVTHSPCVPCVKLLLNTSCQVIVFRHEYAHNAESMNLWLRAGRTWIDGRQA